MYGIENRIKYLRCKSIENYQALDLVVQTAWPHIVGNLRVFSTTERDENARIEWLERKGEGSLYSKSTEYRIYLELVGALCDVHREKIEISKNMPINEYIQLVLDDMLNFVVDNFPEKKKFALNWKNEIVSDDYYKNLRKMKREEKRKNKELLDEEK